MAADFLPTGYSMQDRGLWEGSACPQQCREEIESPEHVYKCPKADELWAKLTSIITEWASKEDIAPGITAAITTGLKQWRDEDGYRVEPCWSRQIKHAFHDQTDIGWEAAAKGM
eukprot:10515066-Ditylum_brightwellii.AAC.1